MDVRIGIPAPEVLEIADGWMAKTPDGDRFSMAVVGCSDLEARERFKVSYEKWLRLASLPWGRSRNA